MQCMEFGNTDDEGVCLLWMGLDVPMEREDTEIAVKEQWKRFEAYLKGIYEKRCQRWCRNCMSTDRGESCEGEALYGLIVGSAEEGGRNIRKSRKIEFLFRNATLT